MSKFRVEGNKKQPNKPMRPIIVVIEASHIEEAVEIAESKGILVTKASSIEKPNCYTPNNDAYPLCSAVIDANCYDCNLSENMRNEGDCE